MTQALPFSVSQDDPGWALSPLDGRYRRQTYPLVEYLSEVALNRWRLSIEVEWLIFVVDHGIVPGLAPLTLHEKHYLRALPEGFGPARQARLAALEEETRHDVKAVEYLVREYLAEEGASLTGPGEHGSIGQGVSSGEKGFDKGGPEGGSSRRSDSTMETSVGSEHGKDDPALDAPTTGPSLTRLGEAVHLLCTSEDINNLAVALGTRAAVENVWLPAASALVDQLSSMAHDLAHIPMLARTHGQSATPTTVGKELGVFAWRLHRQLRRIEKAEYLGKFNGATGTYSAHVAVLPDVDWWNVSREFVESLGLTWNPVTTQIESHDWQSELYADIARFNRIAHNLATDMWSYISLGYFRQELAAQGSTGSSTMPHKVNPIRFENAEANLELSTAVLDVLSQTLATSRLQRDLSDSSIQRNIGAGLGYSLVALDNLGRGLRGLSANTEGLAAELEEHWEVLGEAIQQALRVHHLERASAGFPAQTGAYELLKEATRGRTVTQGDLAAVIRGADLAPELAERLLALTPATYTGLAEHIATYVDLPE